MQFQRILVVDDEAIQREVLAEIVRKTDRQAQVLCASNGEEAYEQIKKNEIELLLTDISMPVMDGICLIEKVAKEFPRIKIVLISAYQDFEYARSAIKYGVSEYLLKPFRRQDAQRVMESIWEEIEDEREKEKRLGNYEKMMGKEEEEKRKQILRALLQGRIKEDNLDNKLREVLNKAGIVVVFRWKVSDGRYNRRYCAQITISQQEQFLKHLSFVFPNGIWVMKEQGLDLREKKAVMILTGTTSAETLWLLKQQAEFLKKEGIIFWAGISNKKENLLKDLSGTLEQAEEALAFYFYTSDKSEIFTYEDIHRILEQPLGSLQAREKELKQAVCAGEKMKQRQIIEKMKKEFGSEPFYYPNRLKHRVSSLIVSVYREMEGMLNQKEYEVLLNEVYEKYGICDSFEQLFDLSLEFLEKLTDEYQNSYKKFDAVESCISYIKEHLEEELSLQSMAEMMHFHPNYLSARIKERVGMSYSSFLLSVRMKAAVSMLQQTDKKVIDIALKCGFKDSSYFNRVFKREYKMSPEQYRKVHKSC